MNPETGQAERTMVPPDARKTREWITVLCATGHDYRLTHDGGQWCIHVPESEAAAAGLEIDAYEEDLAAWPALLEPPPPAAAGGDGGGEGAGARSWSAAGVVLMLGAFYAWLGAFDPRSPVAAAAAADAAGIRAGAWWRVFTALTLHADLHHLAGNMASLALLGHQVTARFGGGLGWLLVLAAAAAGNAAAALLLNPDGVSVGASTAGFAALGLLAAWRAARRGAHTGVFDRRTWLPVAAGLALLALLGTGPRSDLGAHALGFAAGALAALPFRRADHGPRSARIQAALQLLALCVLMYAWRRALQSVP